MHSRIKVHFLENLLFRQHTSVQNARNKDAVPFLTVKKHVSAFFKATQAGANPIAC